MKVLVNRHDRKVVEIVEISKVTIVPEEWDKYGEYYMIKELNIGFHRDQYSEVIGALMQNIIAITVATSSTGHDYVAEIR